MMKQQSFKSCFSLVLALCMMLTSLLAIPASAEGTSISAETVVISRPTFSVSVPAGIPLGDIAKTEESHIKSASFSVGVTDLDATQDKQIRVVVSSPYGAFRMYSGENVLPYRVYDAEEGGNELKSGDTFCTLTEEGSATGRIEVDLYSIPAEGNYGGVMIFTFCVEDIPAT